jgi:6-pyruvoyltetrahydropterin/6-carboxytetrahydropterin synthase
MFAIEVQSVFNASHALRLPDGTVENLHAHTFQVTVKIIANHLDALETVADFHVIESALGQLLRPWQYKSLNDLEPFKSSINPSAERIAEHIAQQLQPAIAELSGAAARGLALSEVRLTEAANCLAIWSAG